MPYLGTTVFVSALAVLLLASLTAYFLLVRALAPTFVARGAASARARPVASFSLGLFSCLAAFIAVAVLLNAAQGPLKLFGVMALSLTVGFVLAGLAGVAEGIGTSLAFSPASPSKALARGSVVVLGSAALPIVGWFVVAPLAVLVGTGAGLFALRRPKAAPISATHASNAVVAVTSPSGWAR